MATGAVRDGFVRVNNLPNLAALLGIFANLFEICNTFFAASCLIAGIALLLLPDRRKLGVILASVSILILAMPGVVQWPFVRY